MELRRQGLEIYKPEYNDILTISPSNFPYKIAKYFKGMEIQAGRLRGYEFIRQRKIKDEQK